MADVKVSEEEVLTGLTEVFRNVGYDGATLNELADATGLRKASLYHRFPEGKQEMAQMVLRNSHRWILNNVSSILKSETEPASRLKRGLEKVSELYSGGEKACLLRSLSLGTGFDILQNSIKSTFEELSGAFKKVALDLGHNSFEASSLALEAVIQIQGSLVVARGVGDLNIFTKALKQIEKQFLRS